MNILLKGYKKKRIVLIYQSMVVPLWQSNYDDEISYTTVFEFPSETRWPEMRQKWIQCIHQKDWIPSKCNVVVRV